MPGCITVHIQLSSLSEHSRPQSGILEDRLLAPHVLLRLPKHYLIQNWNASERETIGDCAAYLDTPKYGLLLSSPRQNANTHLDVASLRGLRDDGDGSPVE